MDGTLLVSDLPPEFTSFQELKEDYPDLSVSDWKELAGAANIPLVKARITVVGRSARRFVQGLSSDNVENIEEIYSSLRAEELRRTDQAELDRMEAEEQAEEIAASKRREIRRAEIEFAEQAEAERLKAEKEVEDQVAAEKTAEIARRKSEARQERAEKAAQKRLKAQRERAKKASDEVRARNRANDVKEADESIISADLLARSLQVKTKNLIRTAKEHGIKLQVYSFGPGPNTVGFNEERANQLRDIEAERKKRIAGDEIYSFGKARNLLGIGNERLKRMLEELEIGPKVYLFGARRSEGLGLTPEEFEAIQAEVKRREIPEAPHDVNAVVRLSGTLGMSPKTLLKLAAGANVSPGDYTFTGNPGKGFSELQVDTMRQAYEPFSLSR